MGVKRYIANKDATITNAFKENLVTRAVSASMGASDVLEVFSILGQASTTSLEASRVLSQFPVDNIRADRLAGRIPASGSVSFYLNLSNAPHGETTPKDFELVVAPVGRNWKEGFGLDMERYEDDGVVNWIYAVDTEEEAGNSFGPYVETTLTDFTYGRTNCCPTAVSVDENNSLLAFSPDLKGDTAPFATGSALVYRSGSSGWTLEAQVSASAILDTNDNLVVSTFIKDDLLLLGVSRASGTFSADEGAVDIYRSGSSGWSLEQRISSSVVGAGSFGFAVSMISDKILVGDTTFNSSGSVFIFSSGSSGWSVEDNLTGSDTGGATFGDHISFCSCGNDSFFVGAQVASGSNDPAQGAVFLFSSGSAGWYLEQRITASDGASFDFFGDGVEFANSHLFVGASGRTETATSQGAVYIFLSSSSGFDQVQKITSPVAHENGFFGISVSANEKGWLAVGEAGNQGFAFGGEAPSGSVYIYESGSSGWILKDFVTDVSTERDFGHTVVLTSNSVFTNYGYPSAGATLEDKNVLFIREYDVTKWETPGGDCLASPAFTSSFDFGDESLAVDITSLVESWIAGAIDNNGICIKLTPEFEEPTSDSFFTKRFFGRRSEHFFKLPWVEARFDDSVKDNRNSFFVSSSLVPAEDNLMTLFLYNRTRKGLKNIPAVGTGPIYMSLYSGTLEPEGPELLLHTGELAITGGAIDTGIYTASVALSTTHERVFDVWHNNLTGAARVNYFTGSVVFATQYEASDQFEIDDYVLNITNLKPEYSPTEKARFRLFTRLKNWSPTIYTVAIADIENETIEDAYYRVFRVVDDFDVIPYGTGSDNHTLLSYDKDGNYFDLDMSVLQPDYQYGISFIFKLEDEFYEQQEVFKFRVR